VGQTLSSVKNVLTVAAQCEALPHSEPRLGAPSGSKRFLGLEYSPQYHLAVSPPLPDVAFMYPKPDCGNARGSVQLRCRGLPEDGPGTPMRLNMLKNSPRSSRLVFSQMWKILPDWHFLPGRAGRGNRCSRVLRSPTAQRAHRSRPPGSAGTPCWDRCGCWGLACRAARRARGSSRCRGTARC